MCNNASQNKGTVMNKNAFIYLVKRIRNELYLYDTGKEESIGMKEHYVPSYLRPLREIKHRRRVGKNLKKFHKVIDIRKDIFKDQTNLTEFIPVLIAILYSESSKAFPLWEYKVAHQFVGRYSEDTQIKLLQDLYGYDKRIYSNGFIENIKNLIKYHKMACLVIGGRLPKIWYDKIKEKTNHIGIMAAVCYDTPGESSPDKKSEKMEKIIDLWKNGGTSCDKADHVILYDLPVCKLGKPDFDRTGFDDRLLKNFKEFLDKQNLTKPFYLTFNYPQSRMLSFDISNPTDDGEIRKDLKKNNNLDKKFYFSKIKQYDELKAELEAEKQNGKCPVIFEFRLQMELALTKLIGMDNLSSSFENKNWLDFINCIANSTCNQSEYYPIPLSNYVPLPLLVRYFRYAYDYSKDFTNATNAIEEMENITYNFKGQLDDHFPGFFEIVVPHKQHTKENIKFTVEKLLCSYATNIGICAGFDRIEMESSLEDKGWLSRINSLMKSDKYGYELLTRYIECFMRSHDVNVSEERLINSRKYKKVLKSPKALDISKDNNGLCSIGIDIGGISIKYRLYDAKDNELAEYRTGTRKNPSDDKDKYGGLNEFAKKLIQGVKALLDKYNTTNSSGKIGFDKIDVMGICWPGVIRDQKIAGASGVLKYFDEKTASNWIRKNTVDSIRKLNLIEELKKEIPNKETVLGLCNDGYAEALGRMFSDNGYRSGKWAILKMGTGTAGCIINEEDISEGLMEFGKLVLNVYLKDSTEKAHETGYDLSPAGDLNKYVSQNLLPNIFRDSLKLDADYSISSFEVGTIGEFFISETQGREGDKLIKQLGTDKLYREKLEHITSKKIIEDILSENTSAFDELNPVLSALDLDSVKTLESKCNTIGAKRVIEILQAIVKSSEENDSFNSVKEGFKLETQNAQPFSKLANNVLTSCKPDFKIFFQKVFDKAGSVLSDAIMLIHEYYKINGVILCGGIMNESQSTRCMLKSIKNHLKQKYYIHFAGYDTYQEDLGKNIVGKKSYTTIYHNFTSDFIEKDGKSIKDQGEIGALIHAKIIKATKGNFEERIVCLDKEEKIIGFKKKNEFTPNDYMAVEVVAFKIKETKKLILFERSPKKSQGRELLFQSGKITEKDLKAGSDKLTEIDIKNAIIRELKEELDFDIKNADRISLLLRNTTPVKQQRKDKMHWFSFYLAVIEVTENEIKTFKPDYTISGIKRQYTDKDKDSNEFKTDICVSSEAKKVNPAADDVFIKMFRLLK